MPDVYFQLGEKVRHWLIDEFQDTSPLQWKILFPLVENSLASGGSLFVVGDTKQAIYGFRQADWRIMHELAVENPFPSVRHHESPELAVSRRSRPRVLALAERVFRARRRRGLPLAAGWPPRAGSPPTARKPSIPAGTRGTPRWSSSSATRKRPPRWTACARRCGSCTTGDTAGTTSRCSPRPTTPSWPPPHTSPRPASACCPPAASTRGPGPPWPRSSRCSRSSTRRPTTSPSRASCSAACSPPRPGARTPTSTATACGGSCSRTGDATPCTRSSSSRSPRRGHASSAACSSPRGTSPSTTS